MACSNTSSSSAALMKAFTSMRWFALPPAPSEDSLGRPESLALMASRPPYSDGRPSSSQSSSKPSVSAFSPSARVSASHSTPKTFWPQVASKPSFSKMPATCRPVMNLGGSTTSFGRPLLPSNALNLKSTCFSSLSFFKPEKMLLNLFEVVGAASTDGGDGSGEAAALALAALAPTLVPWIMFMMFSCLPGYHSTSEYRRKIILTK
mmetsp:Transcript_2114/g.3519  ORF Transcript_2114/g.3519 Transcript_2114/m.3519 type:complete len:206 (+) Transcript_2114:561-1178(+)